MAKTRGKTVRHSARQQGIEPVVMVKRHKQKTKKLLDEPVKRTAEPIKRTAEQVTDDDVQMDVGEQEGSENEIDEPELEAEQHLSDGAEDGTVNKEQLIQSTGDGNEDQEQLIQSAGDGSGNQEQLIQSTGDGTENQEQPSQSITGGTETQGQAMEANNETRESPARSRNSESVEEQTEQSNSTKKKRRGPTRLRNVATDSQPKVDVEFTGVGEHSGPGTVILSSFLGPLVREHVPVILPDWRQLDEATKDLMWDEIQERFNMQEEWQKDAVFKQMGCLWRASKSGLVSDLRAVKSSADRLALKPANIQCTASWNSWVKERTSTAFKVRSDKYKNLRRAQIPHTTSRKGMFRLSCDMKKKSADPRKVTRTKVWIAAHTHSDGTPVRPEWADTIEKIQSIDSQMDSTSGDNIREDAVSQVLGKDKPDLVRGMGRGVTATKLAFLQARDTYVQKLEASQAEMKSKLEDLQKEFINLAGKKKQCDEVGAQPDVSDGSRGGIRCQLLDWIAKDDVIVAEGEFCSAEPSYRIGRIPLGPNAAAVIVKFALNPDASLWRPPTPYMSSIEQAVGIKIMWPYDKVIIDEDIISKKSEMNVSDGSQDTSVDRTLNRCNIHDWISDEIIAEGVMLSTDVTEVVHGIPLGLNAASVKIIKVIKHDAYLWRPTAEMFEMADALNDTIAWSIPNIKLINAQIQEKPLKRSTPSSSINSGSSKAASISSGKGKGAKQKCILLDCGNSGQIVAEGEVFSNDPADVVHSVPLGPNATMVWVIVPKIATAKVWRGNSEIKFISDAVGSTIAWPNEKLKLL